MPIWESCSAPATARNTSGDWARVLEEINRLHVPDIADDVDGPER